MPFFPIATKYTYQFTDAVTHITNNGLNVTTLHKTDHLPSNSTTGDDPCARRTLMFSHMHIGYNDRIVLTADPYKNQDCDGIYIVQWQIWHTNDAKNAGFNTD